jgi:hypothetical protein
MNEDAMLFLSVSATPQEVSQRATAEGHRVQVKHR